jgi:hypothetical protein
MNGYTRPRRPCLFQKRLTLDLPKRIYGLLPFLVSQVNGTERSETATGSSHVDSEH